MRVLRRGTSRANFSSNRLNGTERANRRWFCENTSSSRRSTSASSSPSASIALRACGSIGRMPGCPGMTDRRGASLRRLLRRHLVHLAGREVEAHALDVVEIGAGDADEAGIVGVIDRMDLAVLIDAGVPGQQPIFLDRLELGFIRAGAVVLALPFDHVGMVGGLAVDRPGCAVVMRRRHPRLVVDVGEHLESEIGVLVEQLQAARHALAAVFFDERLVRQQMLELDAYLLAAIGPGVAREDGTTIRDELIEVVRHCCPPWTILEQLRSSHCKAPVLIRPPALQRPRNWPSVPA